MNKYLLIGFSFVLLVTAACKSKKNMLPKTDQTAQEPVLTKGTLLLRSIEEQQNTFDYYSASGEMEYKDSEQSQELSVNIVMEKDRYLYVNITAVLGITVARIYATPDSLVILDLLHRKAIIANYDYVQKMTGATLRLANLQNMIIGNTLFPNREGQCTIDTLVYTVQVLQSLSQTVTQKTLYTKNLKVSESSVTDPTKKQELQVRYGNVYSQGSNLFPAKLNINIRAEKNMETQLELKTFGFEKKKEIQFSIPKSYERVRL
jgi:hypothetical protein